MERHLAVRDGQFRRCVVAVEPRDGGPVTGVLVDDTPAKVKQRYGDDLNEAFRKITVGAS